MPGYVRAQHMQAFKASLYVRKAIVQGDYYSAPAGNRWEIYEWLQNSLFSLFNAEPDDMKFLYTNEPYMGHWSSWSILYLLRCVGTINSLTRTFTNTTYMLASPVLYMYLVSVFRADSARYLDSPYCSYPNDILIDEVLFSIVMYLKESKHDLDDDTIALAKEVYKDSYFATAYNEVFPDEPINVKDTDMSFDFKIKQAMEHVMEQGDQLTSSNASLAQFLQHLGSTGNRILIETNQRFGDYIHVGNSITEQSTPSIAMLYSDTSPEVVINDSAQLRTYEADNVNDPDA